MAIVETRRGAVSRACVRHGLPPALALTLVAATAGSIGAPTARAFSPQAEQTWETGVISGIADGDTVFVDVSWAADPAFIAPPVPADPSIPPARSYCEDRIDADGTLPDSGSLHRCRIRLIGIQAPEKAGASGGSALAQCKAATATKALAAVLPEGTAVQLRSINVRSVEQDYSGGRLARTVYLQDRSGQWVDAGRAVLSGGHAMWFPHSLGDAEKPEYAHNLEYRRLVDEAAAAGRGLWSPGYCGSSAPASLRTWVVSDPIGDDAGNEYVVLRNDADLPLDVGGWTVRDSSLTTVALPAGTVIQPHDHLRVLTGSGAAGTPTTRDFHFGGPSQMFANWDPAAGYFYGDGAYVYDTAPGYAYGNLRAWFAYPCDPASCTDPLVGSLRFGAISYNPPGTDTAAGEYVDVVNVSASAVDLGGYALARRGSQFPFPPSMVLPAGATVRVSVGTGVDSATTLYMGRSASLLANSGDRLTIANLDHAVVDCRAWGTLTCAGLPNSSAPAVPAASSPAPSTKAARPAAPASVTAGTSARRIVVRWTAPAPNGSASVTKYRAKVYRKVGKRLKYRATCHASAKKLTCRTKKLARGNTYSVKVQARNKKGYGPSAPVVSIRLK